MIQAVTGPFRVTVALRPADKRYMSLEAAQAPSPAGEDFGLAGHLASIERMHRDALAQLDALAQPWGNLWSPPLEQAAPRTDEQSARADLTHGAHAAAA